MKAHHIFLAACIAAFALTSCEKEALPEIHSNGKKPVPKIEVDPSDPANEIERDVINLGKPEPIDLNSHERRGSTVREDDPRNIGFTARIDTTIRRGPVKVDLQEHERRGILSVQENIKHIVYTNCVRPSTPPKKEGFEKVETISHQ